MRRWPRAPGRVGHGQRWWWCPRPQCLLPAAPAQVFLDSEYLSELSSLFEHGVHRSDCLVLLATTNVLTRPWCLLELWEARRMAVPVVVVTVAGRALTRDGAHRFVSRLEVELDAINPHALREVRSP